MPLKLPRLQAGFQIINPKDGTPTNAFIQWWQSVAEQAETAINGVEAALAAAGIALDAAEAADAAAAAADAAAANAQSSADATSSETSLVNSYVDNFTAPLISSDNLGNVTIATHDRVYGDPTLNPTVSVEGVTIATGEVNPSTGRISYDAPTRAGGAVTYLFTVDPATPPVQGGDTHSVGAVTIPAAGTQDGGFIRPPGYTTDTP